MRAAALPILLLPGATAAAPDPSWEVGAALGYATPLGSAERGARVGDTTIGQIPFALDVAYRVHPSWAVVAGVAYGLAIPTLCASGPECESSLGSDVVLALGARYATRRLLRVEATVGYEWLVTRLNDGDATTTRAYHGPLLLSLQVAAPFRLGKQWTLGPALGASLGLFTSYSLETNASSPSGSIPDRTIHAWLSLALRLGFAP